MKNCLYLISNRSIEYNAEQPELTELEKAANEMVDAHSSDEKIAKTEFFNYVAELGTRGAKEDSWTKEYGEVSSELVPKTSSGAARDFFMASKRFRQLQFRLQTAICMIGIIHDEYTYTKLILCVKIMIFSKMQCKRTPAIFTSNKTLAVGITLCPAPLHIRISQCDACLR